LKTRSIIIIEDPSDCDARIRITDTIFLPCSSGRAAQNRLASLDFAADARLNEGRE
jgi:hypothetical protein